MSTVISVRCGSGSQAKVAQSAERNLCSATSVKVKGHAMVEMAEIVFVTVLRSRALGRSDLLRLDVADNKEVFVSFRVQQLQKAATGRERILHVSRTCRKTGPYEQVLQ